MIFYGKQDTWFEKQSFFCSAPKCTKDKQQTNRTRPCVKVESKEHWRVMFYRALGKGGLLKINPDWS